MTRIFSHFFWLLATVLFVASCKPDVPVPPELKDFPIDGEWKVVGATRNGKSTKSLEGGVFAFQGDTLATNVFGMDESMLIERDDNKINVPSKKMVMTLTKKLSDTIIISTKYSYYDLEFELLKDIEATKDK